MDKCVACAPINEPYNDADERSVHQFFAFFAQVHN